MVPGLNTNGEPTCLRCSGMSPAIAGRARCGANAASNEVGPASTVVAIHHSTT
jgi:hypothetical protein